MTNFLDFLSIMAVVFVCVLALMLFIFTVWIPFREQRNYILGEIANTSGREKIYWEEKLQRLYLRFFPILRIFRRRKKR